MRRTVEIPHRNSTEHPHVAGISHAIVARGDLVFLCGQNGFDYRTGVWAEGIEEQTRVGIESMKEALECAGASLKDVVKMQVVLADWNEKDRFHDIYKEYFAEHPPVRSRYEATLLAPECLVQMDVVAVIDGTASTTNAAMQGDVS